MTNFKVLVRTNDHPTAKHEVDYDTVVHMMDDGLREEMADKFSRCGVDADDYPQVFVDEYASAHERVFDKPFIVN